MNQTSPRTATSAPSGVVTNVEKVPKDLHQRSLADQVEFWQSRLEWLKQQQRMSVHLIDYAHHRLHDTRHMQVCCVHDCVRRALERLRSADVASIPVTKRRELIRQAILSLQHVDHHVLTSAQLQEVQS